MIRILIPLAIVVVLVGYTYLVAKLAVKYRRARGADEILRHYGLHRNSVKDQDRLVEQLLEAKRIFADLLYFDYRKPEDDILTPETRTQIEKWNLQYNKNIKSLRGNL